MLTNDQQQDCPPGGYPVRKRRKVKLPKDSKLNQKLIAAFNNFVDYVSAKRLNRAMRNHFINHLQCEADRSEDFYDFATDLYFLFQLLDVLSDELKEDEQP